ncbi:TorD/DmsD family molecular chaperone [Sporomusa termitida]|uniref:Tat proofreading chaperone DmsD n=1 Tax=Sporomusa termitida TaxID=2377 RepID=A0A517DPU4_9FIRM|nr:molecular chaperone TorD family protein [Sporomusa termitida]QDR79327.1 Tat proofreading chaperone DmsD [Sporomusa termitida]
MDKERLTAWLHERKFIYCLLARLYKASPATQLLKTLSANRLLTNLVENYVQEENAGQCEVYSAVLQLQAELDLGLKNPADYQKTLQADFNRLFVGPGHLAAPPWESVYRSRERLIFGEQTLAVRAFYRSFGLESKKRHSEPDDHISLELEFMAWLCKQAAKPDISTEKLNLYMSGQTRFLSGHILAWAPALCDDISKAAASNFFRGLALLTKQWLKTDAAELRLL